MTRKNRRIPEVVSSKSCKVTSCNPIKQVSHQSNDELYTSVHHVDARTKRLWEIETLSSEIQKSEASGCGFGEM